MPEISKESWEKAQELSKKYPIKIPSISDFRATRRLMALQRQEVEKVFGNSRSSGRFKNNNEQVIYLEKHGWVLRYFNIRSHNTSDYVLYRQKDLDNSKNYDSIPVIEFNCDNHTLKFNSWGYGTLVQNIPLEVNEMITEFQEQFKTTLMEIVPVKYLKLYIAVLDEVPDYIAPTLVAHSMLGAHLEWYFKANNDRILNDNIEEPYCKWLEESFRKCVVKVNRKAFEKIKKLNKVYLGHENTTLNGEKSCAIPYPVWNSDVPNVLKFAKLWEPGEKGV